MKKHLKQIVATLACLALLLACTGCMPENPNPTVDPTANPSLDSSQDDVTIRVLLADPAGSDLKKMSNAVSEYVYQKLGFHVELVQYTSDYSSKASLAMLSDEQVDLVWCDGNTYFNWVSDGVLHDVSGIIDDYPKLKAAVGDIRFARASIDGKFYGVPMVKEIANQFGFIVDKEFFNSLNLKQEDIKTIADLEPILKAAKEAGKEPWNNADKGWGINGWWAPYYDTVYDVGELLIPHAEGDNTIVSYYMTDLYEEFVKTMSDWYQKGYIREDVLTNNVYDSDQKKWGIEGTTYSPACEGDSLVALLFGEPVILNTSGSMLALAEKSKYYEQSMKFVELAWTDAELANMIWYGLEGTHYTMDENGRMVRMEGYANVWNNGTWRLGNILLSHLTPSDPADKWQQYEDYNNKSVLSRAFGFTPDLSELKAEEAAIKAAVEEYKKILYTGVAEDVDATLADFREALISAGIERYVEEVQAQFNEFKSK